MSTIIEFLEKRGFVDQLTSEEITEVTKKPISVYLGIDPTAASIHLGTFVGIMLLRHFQKFGHRPVLLLGGATGLIGDPSGKDLERPFISEKEVEKNVTSIKKLVENLLPSHSPGTAPLFVNNYDWFSGMNFIEFLRDVGKFFRVGPMMSKESVKSRISSEEGMSFTEFSYQTLQGYDFCHLFQKEGVILQVGGSDQYGNITAGIEFTRKKLGQTVYGLTFPLLVRSDGKKFGKSEEGAIWIDRERFSPYQLYQYLFGIPDVDVIKMLKILTEMDLSEIKAMQEQMKAPDYVPNSVQKRLAEEVTRIIHGEEGMKEALSASSAMKIGKDDVSEKDLKEQMAHLPHIKLVRSEVLGAVYIDLAIKAALFPSKGEARRMVQNGGAYLNRKRVEDPQKVISEQDLLGEDLLLLNAGKKKALVVQLVEKNG